MVEERITTHEGPRGEGGTTHTTIVHDGASSGGSRWFIGLVLLLALVAGIFFFSQFTGSEVAKDDAIANAANEVGDAAGAVGDAARQAGEAARDTARNVAPSR